MDLQSARMPDREFPDLVLALNPISCLHGPQVYGLGFAGGSIIFKKLLSFDKNTMYNIGFAVSGTKLFAVGSPGRQYTDNVKIWDLSDWRNKTGDEFPVKCGQTLGEKPRPVVFEVDGRIYALAGLGYGTKDKPSPAFEVFDPNTPRGGWRRLSDPPFLGEYSAKFYRQIKCHALIGKTLFVGVIYFGPRHIQQGPWKYYSYDVLTDTWETITNTTHIVDPRARNFLKHCKMQEIDVCDNLMVFSFRRNLQVYACDLNADAELAELPPESKKANTDIKKNYRIVWDSDSDEEPEPVLSDAFVPVSGLESIATELAKHCKNNQIVAHLAGDVYCGVYFYLPLEKEYQKILVILFEAFKEHKEKRCISAKIFARAYFEDDLIMNPQSWCKLNSSV